MREQFVSFEIAQLMKQKGFVESCFRYYCEDGELSDYNYSTDGECYDYTYGNKIDTAMSRTFYCSAPLWQQAIDWLRDVKGVFIDLTLHDRENTETWKYEISEYGYYNMLAQENVYQSYYNTREIAIKKALELI